MRAHLQQKFTHIFVDEFQDTDPIQAEISAARSPNDVPRQALHRRRSEAGDLSVPRHRRRHLLGRLPRARGARRPRAAADDELSQRAGDSALRERRLCAGDDRRPGHSPGRLRAAVTVARTDDDRSRRSWRCRCRKPYGRGGFGALKASAKAIDGSLPGRDRRLHRLAHGKERLDRGGETGRRPRDPRAAAAAPRRGAVPPLRQLRRGRDARLRRRDRGARHSASAGRRQSVPRTRRGGNDPRRTRGDRVAGRRAVGVRDLEGIAVRDRRRAAARVPSSVCAGAVSSVPDPQGARRELAAAIWR